MLDQSKPPIGVAAACLVLAFATALAFGTAILVAGLAVHPRIPSSGLASTGGVAALLGCTSIALVGLSVWTGATVVGLYHLRPWARRSILLLGALLALFGIVCVAVAMEASSPAVLAIAAPSLSFSPHTMPNVLLFAGLFYSATAACGAWWLVYFNLRSARAAFQPKTPHFPGAGSSSPEVPNPDTPTNEALSTFNQRRNRRRPQPEGRSHLPVPIVLLACVLLLSAVMSLFSGLIPMPAFLFGVILRGSAKHLVYAGLTVALAGSGIGLLRLDNRARLATYALLLLGSVNLVLAPIPWVHASLERYTAEIDALLAGTAAPAANAVVSEPALLLAAAVGLTVYGLVAWVLHRYRRLFQMV